LLLGWPIEMTHARVGRNGSIADQARYVPAASFNFQTQIPFCSAIKKKKKEIPFCSLPRSPFGKEREGLVAPGPGYTRAARRPTGATDAAVAVVAGG